MIFITLLRIFLIGLSVIALVMVASKEFVSCMLKMILVALLFIVVRTLGKRPPDSLFDHESSLTHLEPVHTLDTIVHSSSSTKRLTEPIGEDVSIIQQRYEQDVSSKRICVIVIIIIIFYYNRVT